MQLTQTKRLYEWVQKNSVRSEIGGRSPLDRTCNRHRHLLLVLKYLDHLQLDPAHLARKAKYEAHALFRAGHPRVDR
jgi:hypothetical protein